MSDGPLISKPQGQAVRACRRNHRRQDVNEKHPSERQKQKYVVNSGISRKVLDLNYGLSRTILSDVELTDAEVAGLEELADSLGINAIRFWEKVMD